MGNLDIWNEVCKTDPSNTKSVNFGRKITAIDPYSQIKAATAQFGAVGDGWGWSVGQVCFLPTNEVAVEIVMWHGESGRTFSHFGQNSLYIDKAETKKDTDCLKKATTDGITKCLSLLGFNADVFEGKFDDNKYVQQQSHANSDERKGRVTKAKEAMKKFEVDVFSCEDNSQLDSFLATQTKLTDAFKDVIPEYWSSFEDDLIEHRKKLKDKENGV